MSEIETKKKARILLTLDCTRNCKLCKNKSKILSEAIVLEHLADPILEDYDEIILSGGDLASIPYALFRALLSFRDKRCYIDLIRITDDLETIMKFRLIYGITFYVHNPLREEEVFSIPKVTKYIERGWLPGPNKLLFGYGNGGRNNPYFSEYCKFFNTTSSYKMTALQECKIPTNEDLFLLSNQ